MGAVVGVTEDGTEDCEGGGVVEDGAEGDGGWLDGREVCGGRVLESGRAGPRRVGRR